VCCAVCCNVLQCDAVISTFESALKSIFWPCRRVTVCCFVLRRVAMCCSVLQCVTVCYSMLQCVAVCCSVLQCVAVCCSALQRVAVCCNASFVSALTSIAWPYSMAH